MQLVWKKAASLDLITSRKCVQHAVKQISTLARHRWVRKIGSSPKPDSPSAQSTPSGIFQLDAEKIRLVHNSQHVAIVNNLLQKAGILKIKMKFHDSTSNYLEQLIMGLHEYHCHGLPITHSMTRGWFWDVKPAQAEAPSTEKQQTARSETMKPFSWHSDCSYEQCPPRYFALQVLEHDKYGGGTISVLPVVRLIETLSAATIDQLCRPDYLIKVPREFIKNEVESKIIGPVLSRDRCEEALRSQPCQSPFPAAGDRYGRTKPNFHLRYRADITYPLNSAAAAALEELRSRISNMKGPNNGVVHLTPDLLPTGSILLMDNGSWLHARNEVKDVNRHLRRVRWDAHPFVSVDCVAAEGLRYSKNV